MKKTSLLKSVLVAIAFTIGSNAFAGVLHPCPDSAFDTVRYSDIHITSLDGRFEAVLGLEKIINKSCKQVIHDYLSVTANVVKSSDGQSIYPMLIEMTIKTLSSGTLIDQIETQAPLGGRIRLHENADSVEIAIEGFETVLSEL